MPTFGSLFAGIGGMDLGLERAGWECKWQVEIDEFCQSVLAAHWPSVDRYGAIETVAPERLAPVDLVCGGFPCQPTSRAGRRLAQGDDRWLWPEFARIVRHLRPRFVLVENPEGVLDRGIADVLGDLSALGYDAEWDRLPASALGARHQRQRVFLVAYPAGEGLQGHPAARKVWGREFPPRRIGWEPEPELCRVANGVPGGVDKRIDRTRALGNAVVPQVAEWIGRRLMEVA